MTKLHVLVHCATFLQPMHAYSHNENELFKHMWRRLLKKKIGEKSAEGIGTKLNP